MDIALRKTPLQAEISALRKFLATAEPQEVTKLKAEYRRLREKRAEIRTIYDAACETQRTEHPGRGSSPEMRRLESELTDLDGQVGSARIRLQQQVLAWGSKYFREARRFLEPDIAELERAIELIEAAADLHRVNDDYVRNAGLQPLGYVQPRLSDKLDKIVDEIRLFVKSRETKTK